LNAYPGRFVTSAAILFCSFSAPLFRHKLGRSATKLLN